MAAIAKFDPCQVCYLTGQRMSCSYFFFLSLGEWWQSSFSQTIPIQPVNCTENTPYVHVFTTSSTDLCVQYICSQDLSRASCITSSTDSLVALLCICRHYGDCVTGPTYLIRMREMFDRWNSGNSVRVSMGLTVSRKTVKNLAVRRKN